MSARFLSRVLRVCWGALRSALFLANNLYCIPCHVAALLLLRPLLWSWPAAYWRLEGVLFSWLLNMVGMLSYCASYDIVETGDNIEPLLERRCLLVANHQSTGDVPLLMNMMTAPSRGRAANRAMWIMDSMFRWTNFGLVSQMHRDFFIECGRANRDRSVEQLRRALPSHFIEPDRRWLLLFPEGGFLHKRQATSQRFAEKNNLPALKLVTLPRTGAALAILQTLAPSVATTNCHMTAAPSSGEDKSSSVAAAAAVCNGCGCGNVDHITAGDHCHAKSNGVDSHCLEYVVDITIAYPEQRRPLNIWSIICASRDQCHVIFHYRVFPISQVPRAKDQLTEWLYQLFYDKEKMLADYYGGVSARTASGDNAGISQSADTDAVHNSTASGNGSNWCGRGQDTCGEISTDGGRGPMSLGRGLSMGGRGRIISHDPLAWILRHCFFIVASYILFSGLYTVASCLIHYVLYSL